MVRFVCWILLAILTAAPQVRAQAPDPAGADVAAIITRASPSIACILVSRSAWYRKLGFVPADGSGVLGGFDAADLQRAERQFGIRPFDVRNDPFDRRNDLAARLDLGNPAHYPEAFGSGIILDRSGLVLTSYHVVQDATKIFVRWPGGKGSYADIHAADPRSDLAVLRLLTPGPQPLVPLELGNADDLRRGQTVIALTNPFAVGFLDGQPSASTGIISNLRRRIPGRVPLQEGNANPLYQFGILIQTDARLALGSSGGALLDTSGKCIGITTALAAIAGTDAPGGFAMPVTTSLRKIIDVLRRGEEVEYGFLGVSWSDFPAKDGGVIVKSTPDGSPAFREAELKKGDVIVGVDRFPVRDNQDLLLALGQFLAGDRIRLSILRYGRHKDEREVTLVKYNVTGKKIASSPGNRPYVGGLRVDYTSLLAQPPSGASRIPPGVLITEVKDGSKAARLELKRDDIILRVGNRSVNTPEQFYKELERQELERERSPRREPVMLHIRRGDGDTVTKAWQ